MYAETERPSAEHCRQGTGTPHYKIPGASINRKICAAAHSHAEARLRQQPFSSGAHPRERASPPAAGRLISPTLFQPMVILAERFYVIGRNFL